MSKISAMLDVGKRSLMNSQTALQTVGHNIANKSTEGYSRQRVELQTNDPIGTGNLRIGTGARAAQVTRVNNAFMEKQLQKEGAELGYAKGKADSLSRVEQVFNEQLHKGLNQFLGEFFNAFRELSNNPESLATRTLVRETAAFLVNDFHRIHEQMRDIQTDVDQQILTHVESINQVSKEIAQLNEKIQQVEIAGTEANDERDRRDLLLKKLGEKLDIKHAESDNGQVTVTAGGIVLVSGYSSRDLTTGRSPEREGLLDIYYVPGDKATPYQITSQIKGGELGGILNVRDDVIERFLGRMDEMAYKLGEEVNKAHVMGFDRYGRQGEAFFAPLAQTKNACANIQVNGVVLNDIGRIAAARYKNAPADNTIARVISNIQYKGIMNEGDTNLDDFYNGLVGQVGVIAQRATRAHEAQDNIVNQLKNLRESISGVSIDEEMTKMIEFQKSFDASARLVRTADEMLDTVLNIRR